MYEIRGCRLRGSCAGLFHLAQTDVDSMGNFAGCCKPPLYLWLIIVLSLWACGRTALALPGAPLPMDAGSAVVVGPGAPLLHLGPHIQYRLTGLEPLTPEGLTDTSEWIQNEAASVNLGYQADAGWFRVNWQTDAAAAQEFMLEITSSQLDDLHVFLYEGGRLLQRWHAGDRLPFAERPYPDRNFVFPVTLTPDRQYQLYFRVHNSEAMEFSVLLAERTAYSDFSNSRAMIDGVFYGILIIMAAYSIALYLTLLDRTYLYYVFYILSMLAFFLWQQGMLYQYLYPDWPAAQQNGAAVISVLIFFFVVQFFGQFLEIGRTLPRTWRLYQSLVVLHIILCSSLFWFEYQTIINLMLINTVLATLVGASAIIRLAVRGSSSAQLVLIGWTTILFCLMFFAAAKAGLIYNEFMANYGLRVGVSLEILIFSFALSFRINQTRREKELALQQASLERNERMRAQELALRNEMEARQAKEAALLLEIKHSESLQHQVTERTAELARTLANLEQANRELEKLSALDALTGIFNRRSFNEKLRENWSMLQRESQPLSVMLIDIDHFKHVNDSG